MRPARRNRNPIYNEFDQNMPEVFFISKMNKIENYNLSNEYQNENFQISWIFLQFLLDFAQKFPLYTK